jgi:hypothetical protein
LAILGVSFRLLAKAVLPFAVLFILAGCGGTRHETGIPTAGVRGEGFTFQVPAGWHVSRPTGAVVAKSGKNVVSVTVFTLRKAYDPAQFGAVAKTLDSVVARLAKAAGTTVSDSESTTIGDRKSRSYRYGSKRIAFVLEGVREYQLFCSTDAAACDVLFSSFSLSA